MEKQSPSCRIDGLPRPFVERARESRGFNRFQSTIVNSLDCDMVMSCHGILKMIRRLRLIPVPIPFLCHSYSNSTVLYRESSHPTTATTTRDTDLKVVVFNLPKAAGYCIQYVPNASVQHTTFWLHIFQRTSVPYESTSQMGHFAIFLKSIFDK